MDIEISLTFILQFYSIYLFIFTQNVLSHSSSPPLLDSPVAWQPTPPWANKTAHVFTIASFILQYVTKQNQQQNYRN